MLFGALLYVSLSKKNDFSKKDDFRMFIIFINMFNVTVAAFWEFYEYALLYFFDDDAINHYTTGVHDAMTDMILATFSGLILSLFFLRYYLSKKENVLIRILNKHYELNVLPKIEK